MAREDPWGSRSLMQSAEDAVGLTGSVAVTWKLMTHSEGRTAFAILGAAQSPCTYICHIIVQ